MDRMKGNETMEQSGSQKVISIPHTHIYIYCVGLLTKEKRASITDKGFGEMRVKLRTKLTVINSSSEMECGLL